MSRSIDSLGWWNSLNLVVKGVVANISVGNFGLLMSGRLPGEGMLHPLNIISIWVVISGVSTSGFLSVLGSVHGHLTLNQEVFELKSFDQVSVPYVTSVTELKVLIFL